MIRFIAIDTYEPLEAISRQISMKHHRDFFWYFRKIILINLYRDDLTKHDAMLGKNSIGIVAKIDTSVSFGSYKRYYSFISSRNQTS